MHSMRYMDRPYGVPEFRHQHALLDTRHTCIWAKQVKSPPPGNTMAEIQNMKRCIDDW